MPRNSLPETTIAVKPSCEALSRVRFTILVSLSLGLSSVLILVFVPAYASTTRSFDHALHLLESSSSPLVESANTPTGKAPDIFVGVLSHPGNDKRRRAFRKDCAPKFRESGVQYKIFIGRPSEHVPIMSSHQGQHASALEIAQSRNILNESLIHKDIYLLPLREHYRDLTDKVIKVYQYGTKRGAGLIVKLDDDQCLDAAKVLYDVRERQRAVPKPEIYLGTHVWNGREDPRMIGPHNHSAPYMGSLSGLSWKLAHFIFDTDRDFTVMYSVNGTSSEDTNVGRWVQRAQNLNPDMNVLFLANPSYVRHVKVSGTKV